MNRKILIVEDSAADAKTLRMALARRDPSIETLVLEDGAQAIDYFSSPDRKNDFQLVLLDLNLPLVSGFEVLEFLKADPELKKLPVVVLSGSSTQEDVEKCYETGANSYICKPTGIDGVFSMASELVNYWFGQATLPKVAPPAHVEIKLN